MLDWRTDRMGQWPYFEGKFWLFEWIFFWEAYEGDLKLYKRIEDCERHVKRGL